MKYILIIAWLNYGSGRPHVSIAVEYNTLQACQASSVAISKQAGVEPSVMLCTAKG